MSQGKTWFVIINPTSGNSLSKKRWPKIKILLERNDFDFNFRFTEYPNHSIKLLQDSVIQGFRKFIIVGGDGTLHNVVNAIQTQNICNSKTIKVGIIPVGTGNDWVKTYGISKNHEKAIKRISIGNYKHQDVGKIEFLKQSKNPVYFNNLAGIGFDGFVVSKVSKFKNFGSIAYFIAALFGLFFYKNFNAEILVNSKKIKTKVLMAVIGLCAFSGGGMRLTKDPISNDGLFDVSIVKDFSKFDIIKNLFNLFNGKIVNYKKVLTFKTKFLEVKSKDQNILVEADGELIGAGDFKVSIIKNAFTFYV